MYIFQIKELRKNKYITKSKLAKLSEISRSYLTELENETKTNPTLETLFKISQALEVNVKDLFYTFADIEKIKQDLEIEVSLHGLSSPKANKLNSIIDKLMNLKLNKEIR